MIFGMQLYKWILIILVNLLRCMPCTSLPGDVMLTSLKSCRSPCTWHCHYAAERDAIFYPSRDVATQFARFESGGLQHLGYSSREGLPFADPWCEWLKRTSADEVEAAGPHHHHGSDYAMTHRLNACVRVNCGHFEHKFWASDFLLCFVCFIDTGFRKCDRYKHVGSANIVWNVLLFCLTFSHGMVTT